MIGVFTIVIIWLARRGLEFFIKAIVLFALWMSLFYAVQPYVALVLYFLGLDTLFVVAILSIAISSGSIYLLHIFPEWYVVNGVGIMVGAGVITLIGVSFVPVLIIGFMIAAAIYDYWAVNGSKHMLELADTMIDLKLPVLLVAPKNADYSFIEEDDSVMRDKEIEVTKMDWEDPVPHIKNEEGRPTKGRDALFMGLGDVIFPGMLVISSVSFLPQTGGEVTYFSAFGVMYATNSNGIAYGNQVTFTSKGLVSIGDLFQGGIVAHIIQPGEQGYVSGEQHGIVILPYDYFATVSWCGNISSSYSIKLPAAPLKDL